MMSWLTRSVAILTVAAAGSCTQPGTFCALYTPVLLEPGLARDVVAQDRAAAEAIATNNRLAEGCR